MQYVPVLAREERWCTRDASALKGLGMTPSCGRHTRARAPASQVLGGDVVRTGARARRTVVHARCFGPEGPRHDAFLRKAYAGEGARATSARWGCSTYRCSREKNSGAREML